MIEFPKHHILSINHNEHKSCYQTVGMYLDDNEMYKDCITPDDLKICIERNELWELRWYPITPISFYHICSYSLERCLEIAKGMFPNKEERGES